MLNPAEHPTCTKGHAVNGPWWMKMSLRYAPHIVCSLSAMSWLYKHIRTSRNMQGAGISGTSDKLEEAVVLDWSRWF
jgi:hypothetical protein